MISLREIHYEIENQELLEFFNKNEKNIIPRLDDIMRYFNEKNISVGCFNIYGLVENMEIQLFSNGMMVYKNDIKDGFAPNGYTEIFKKINGHREAEELDAIERTLLKVMLAGFYLAYSLEKGQYRIKTKKEKFSFNHKLKSFDYNMSIKEYRNGSELFVVEEKHDKVSFICNYPSSKRMAATLPSAIYRMPNKGKVRCFHPGNTKVLDATEIDMALTGLDEKLGKCYSNSEEVMNLLKRAGYEKRHTIQYFSGWIMQYKADKLIHHAWIVIDGFSVLDCTIKRSGKFVDYINAIERGEYRPFSRELLADWIHQELEEKAPFSKYHFCGETPTCIYIGTECTSEEARQSLCSIIEEYPKLSGYNNINKGTFKNKLQQIYTDKFEN
jgi:hypothetical protein